MIDTVRTDLLSTLERVLQIFQKEDQLGEIDYLDLKELSNTTIHNSSIFQDEDSISIAVIIYSMSKIFERTKKTDLKLRQRIEEMYHFLRTNHKENFHKAIRNAMISITKLDGQVGLYIQEVLQQARIKKGSKIYEHGISVAQSADLLGISQWQLLDYLGKTTINEYIPQSVDVKKRLDFARSLFNGTQSKGVFK